jgi:hypothetical protein
MPDSNIESQREKSKETESSTAGSRQLNQYPPMRTVVIIMCAVYIAMLLVSLVCH